MRDRNSSLAELVESTVDVLVIGGGVTGAGVALDAATRGYSTALIERQDYAAGTSSRSSKLVHGGLRYLQNFDLGLVREAVLERQLNAALAPHIVHPIPLIIPAFDDRRLDRILGIGLNMYDVMAVERRSSKSDLQRADGESTWSASRHRVISGPEVVARLPRLADRQPTGGYLFYDCQTDDVRLVLTILEEAHRYGAVAANHVGALEISETDGPLINVRCVDNLAGEEFDIQARTVVNATGVWADRLAPPGDSESPGPIIRPSRGTHILLDHNALTISGVGAIAPAGEGRTIFILPWLGRTLVGTTDSDYDERELDHVPPAESDIAYLLDATNKFFASSFSASDIAGAYAGVRPLVASGDPKKSVDISRKAELYDTAGSRVLTITGGKLTTWRRMAKLVVDRIVERDSREVECRTASIPLGYPVKASELIDLAGVSQASREALAQRYGYTAHDVLELAAQDPVLREPIVDDLPDILAGVSYAARSQQAMSVGDVLLRRTRIGLLAARRIQGEPDRVRAVARVLGAELGWDHSRTEKEVTAYLELSEREGLVPS